MSLYLVARITQVGTVTQFINYLAKLRWYFFKAFFSSRNISIVDYCRQYINFDARHRTHAQVYYFVNKRKCSLFIFLIDVIFLVAIGHVYAIGYIFIYSGHWINRPAHKRHCYLQCKSDWKQGILFTKCCYDVFLKMGYMEGPSTAHS